MLVIALSRNLDEAENLLSWDRREITPSVPPRGGISISQDIFLDAQHGDEATSPTSTKLNAPEAVEDIGTKKEWAQGPEAVLERGAHLVKELQDRQQEFKVCPSITMVRMSCQY